MVQMGLLGLSADRLESSEVAVSVCWVEGFKVARVWRHWFRVFLFCFVKRKSHKELGGTSTYGGC